MLLKLKKFIQSRSTVNMQDLTREFNRDPVVIRDMLKIFINKGQLKTPIQPLSCKGGCASCEDLGSEVFAWVSR